MGVSNTSKFFEHIGKALSEASANIKTHEKAGNKSDEIMWRKLHHELTHSVSKMHQPQYDNLNKVSTT